MNEPSIELVVRSYYLKVDGILSEDMLDICLQRTEGVKWAVRRINKECLNKNGEWEVEPLPFERNEEFLKRCRFDTKEEAIETYIRWSKNHG